MIIDNRLINLVICIDDMHSLNKIISLYKCKDLNDSEKWGVYKDKISNDNNIIIATKYVHIIIIMMKI